MKGLVLKKGGSIDGFEVSRIEKPQYKDDELLIKVMATGLNPSDYQTAEYLSGDNLNVILGLDVAGVVEEVGSECKDFKVGDRVFYLREISNPNGGFAEYAVTPAKFACKIPKELLFEEAAALPGSGFTAYHILEQRFHLVSGRTILIQGGAGGIGSYAIQLAKNHNLNVITTCLQRDIPYVLSLGADYAIDFENEDVYQKINQITCNKGVDYALSTIGSAGATKDLSILKFNGELAVTSGLPDFNEWKFYEKGITIHEIALGNFLTLNDIELNMIPVLIGNKLSSLVKNREISIPKITLISLDEIPNYLKMIKKGSITGKVVIKF